MNDTLKTIHDVDHAFLAVERARLVVESAKASLELAKQEAEAARVRLEESLSKAEELGLPRAKLRKVAEERVSALLTSGLLREDPVASEKLTAKVSKKPGRRAKAVEFESADTGVVTSESDREMSSVEPDWVSEKAPAEILAEASA